MIKRYRHGKQTVPLCSDNGNNHNSGCLVLTGRLLRFTQKPDSKNRYLEILGLFWIEACFAAAWSQLLAACICGCIRQFRRQSVTRKPLPTKTWKRLFWGGAVLLVILILGACRIAPVYIAANAAQEDSAAGYAGVFFPLIITAEFATGFLIWRLWQAISFSGRIERDWRRKQ